jgi:glutamyl-tRNA synthetase
MSAHDGRYAPSPSGPLHVGNLRTALLAWLFARSQHARFVLRIEDLDPQRSRREYEHSAIADLRRLGLDWDGEPLRQSEQRERHREAFAQLRGAGRVYPCWCTRAEVRRASRAPHGEDDDGGSYPGTCRELSADQRRARERSGPPRAWRLAARGERVSFTDLIHGRQSGIVDDFVLWRGDDVPAYNLAVVVDDADEQVGEVVRGDDLLETTPRQVLLAELLSLATPRYVHVPLVLGEDGKRVAKRHSGAPGAGPIKRDEPVEQLIGWMASSVGLAEQGASLSAAALLARFDASRQSQPTLLEALQRDGTPGRVALR